MPFYRRMVSEHHRSPAAGTFGDKALDAWLEAELRASYEDVLSQPVPKGMLRLFEREPERCRVT